MGLLFNEILPANVRQARGSVIAICEAAGIPVCFACEDGLWVGPEGGFKLAQASARIIVISDAVLADPALIERTLAEGRSVLLRSTAQWPLGECLASLSRYGIYCTNHKLTDRSGERELCISIDESCHPALRGVSTVSIGHPHLLRVDDRAQAIVSLGRNFEVIDGGDYGAGQTAFGQAVVAEHVHPSGGRLVVYSGAIMHEGPVRTPDGDRPACDANRTFLLNLFHYLHH